MHRGSLEMSWHVDRDGYRVESRDGDHVGQDIDLEKHVLALADDHHGDDYARVDLCHYGNRASHASPGVCRGGCESLA